MSLLRSQVIHLASTLPTGSRERWLVLSTIKIAEDKSPIDEVLHLIEQHGLKTRDVLDLSVFCMRNPPDSMEGDDPVKVFTSWWGGMLPKPWKGLSAGDLKGLFTAYSDALPDIVATASRIKGTKVANVALMGLLTATSWLSSSDWDADMEAFRKERDKDARRRDDVFRPPTEMEVERYSQKEGKSVKFTGTYNACSDWENDLKYNDYTWAKGQMGEEPDSKQVFLNRSYPIRSLGDRPPSSILQHLMAGQDSNIASHVRQAIKAGEDPKKTVPSRLKKRKDIVRENYQEARNRHLETEFNKEELGRAKRILNEEASSVSTLEKILHTMAPEWGKKKVEDKAKSRTEKEKSEGTAPRSYQDYLAGKKSKGGRPMDREEWESRYK